MKRCFRFTACEYESRCEHAHTDIRHGQFQAEQTGEYCHHFKPLAGDAKEWGIGPDRDEE